MENTLENPVSSAESTNSMLKPIQTLAQQEQVAATLPTSADKQKGNSGRLRKIIDSFKGGNRTETQTTVPQPVESTQDSSEEIIQSPATKRFMENNGITRIDGGVPKNDVSSTQQ